MTTPTNDDKKDFAEHKEPVAKGGVAGTDSKDFNSSGPFDKEPKPEKDVTKHPTNG